MNDSKRPAVVSLNALANVCQRIDNVLKMLFKMDLKCISLSLKRIGNVQNALEMLFNAFTTR